jgi:hypothetical protein
MYFDHQGRRYHVTRARDLKRDGIGLELHADDRHVAEVFYWDATGEFTITVFQLDVPLAVVQQLISAAEATLPPATKVHGL